MKLDDWSNFADAVELYTPIGIFHVDHGSFQFVFGVVQRLQVLFLDIDYISLPERSFYWRFSGIILWYAWVFYFFKLWKSFKWSFLLLLVIFTSSLLFFQDFEVDFNMGISNLSFSTVLYNLSLFVLFLADIFYSFWTFIIKIQLFWFSSDKSLSFFLFDGNGWNSIKGYSLSLIRKWANRVVSFSYFSYKLIIRVSWKYLQHSLSVFIVFALPLDNEENAINHFSF